MGSLQLKRHWQSFTCCQDLERPFVRLDPTRISQRLKPSTSSHLLLSAHLQDAHFCEVHNQAPTICDTLVYIGNSSAAAEIGSPNTGPAGPTAGRLGSSSGLVSPSSGTTGVGSGEAGLSSGPALPPGLGAGATFQGTSGSGPHSPDSTDYRAGPPPASGIATTALNNIFISGKHHCMCMVMCIVAFLGRTKRCTASSIARQSDRCQRGSVFHYISMYQLGQSILLRG